MGQSDEHEAVLEEQTYTRGWVRHNLDLLVPLAREGYQLVGRGAVLVNVLELILRRHSEEGHPFNYHAPSAEWLSSDELAQPPLRIAIGQALRKYQPEDEFVLVLVKGDRSTVQRVPFPSVDEMDLEIRGAYVNAEKEERHNRLTCTDFWARPYRLTTPFTPEWLYRVA